MNTTCILATTVLLDTESFDILLKIRSESGGKNLRKFFLSVLCYIIEKHSLNSLFETRKTVKYQKNKIKLRLYHVRINSNIYESLLAIKNLKKISISRLISEGIIEYFNKIVSSDLTTKPLKTLKSWFFDFLKADNYTISFSLISQYNATNSLLSLKTRIGSSCKT